MTDRELLELAAKAAGLRLIDWNDSWAEFGPGWRYEIEDGSRELFNPLIDDGDALRLAVKLHIDIYTQDGDGKVGALDAECNETWEPEGDDPLAATRRCIVRAAAELGKAMP